MTALTTDPAATMACPPCDEMLHVANLAVLRALELAGKRMVPRHLKSEMGAVPAHEVHTRLEVDSADDLDRLLRGAWDLLALAQPGRADLVAAVDAYTREYLYEGYPHSLEDLRAHLSAAGLVEGG